MYGLQWSMLNLYHVKMNLMSFALNLKILVKSNKTELTLMVNWKSRSTH